MIKRSFQYIWDIMIDIGEARQARLKSGSYSMWY